MPERLRCFVSQICFRVINISVLCLAIFCIPIALSAHEVGDKNKVAQSTLKKISGSIVDQSGEAVIGASIVEKGNPKRGTISDMDGLFSIQVPDNAVLEVSYIGFMTKEIPTAGKISISIILEEEVNEMDEVVVVGYGTMKKANLTGSVATVNFAEKMEGMPVLNTAASLSGAVAGMNVTQGSGQPGAETVSIRIRGMGTFNTSDGSNSPLILVDGQEWSMSNVNPNDIESITVLKDAASTAIYGVKGANGVIIITTKTGKGKPQINYSFSGIVQSPYNNLKFISDYATYMELVNEGTDNVSATNIFSQNSIDTWRQAKLDPNGSLLGNGVPNYMAFPNTEWFDAIFHRGFSQQHNLSFSKSSDTSSLLVSLGYLDNEGVMSRYNIDSGMKRIDFRTNAESKIHKWFTLGTRISGQRQDNGMANLSTAFNRLYMTTPGIYPGSANKWGVPALEAEESSNANNILQAEAGGTGHHYIYRLNTSAYFKFAPIKGASLEGTARYAPAFTDRESYSRPNGTWDYVNDVRRSESNLDNATITVQSGYSHTFDTELLARYNGSIGKDHEFGGLLGFVSQQYEIKSSQMQKKGATDWGIHDLGSYATIESVSNSSLKQRSRLSYFGRLNYAYANRYLFEANMRYDGTSKFGNNKRWGVFPAVSGAWRISQESFMHDVNYLSNLKLRLSYGKTGNDAVGYYDAQSLYKIMNATVDGVPSKGLALSKLSNLDLGWETTHTLDLGLDFGFFNNKLSGEIDYYHRKSTDILYNPALYLTTGYVTAPKANLGELNNKGIELSLNWRDNIGKDFSYSIGANFAYSTNEVTKFKGRYDAHWVLDEAGNRESYVTNFSDVAEEGFGNGGYIAEGRKLGETFYNKLYRGTGAGYSGSGTVDINAGPRDGMIRTEQDMEWVKAMLANGYTFDGKTSVGKNQLWYGDFIYADTNDDKNYGDSNDREFSGHTSVPKYNLGLNLSVRYKDFDFSMQWAGALGFHLLWTTGYYNTTAVSHGYGIIDHIANDHYFYDPLNPENSKTNLNGKYPRLTFGETFSNTKRSDFYEYKGDYLKLKNVQIGYQIPTKISSKLHIQKMRAYVSMQNILTITDYPGLDPEMGTNIGYPLMKQVSFGAQITF